jgi:hypothetical protein
MKLVNLCGIHLTGCAIPTIARHSVFAGVRGRRGRVSPVVVMIPQWLERIAKSRAPTSRSLARALALAVEAVDRLPPNWQGSDKTAWIALLHRITAPGKANNLRLLARARLEQRGIEVV